jgi:hypothetical protein
LRLGITICLAIATAGCVQYSEEIHFNTDGSGWVKARLDVPARFFAGDTSLSRIISPRIALAELGRKSIQKRILREGVSLRRFETTRGDTVWSWYIEYYFRDIEAFRRVHGDGHGVSVRKHPRGAYELEVLFTRPVTHGGVDFMANAETHPRLVRDLSIIHVFNMPGRVISTPGGRNNGKTARFAWSGKNPASVLRPESMRVVFKGTGVDWPVFEALPVEPPNGDRGMYDDYSTD